MLNEGNQIHNFISSSGSGTVINYGSGSDFLTSYGSGSTRQKVTVPAPQHWSPDMHCIIETERSVKHYLQSAARQASQPVGIGSLESILGHLKRLKIRLLKIYTNYFSNKDFYL